MSHFYALERPSSGHTEGVSLQSQHCEPPTYDVDIDAVAHLVSRTVFPHMFVQMFSVVATTVLLYPSLCHRIGNHRLCLRQHPECTLQGIAMPILNKNRFVDSEPLSVQTLMSNLITRY